MAKERTKKAEAQIELRKEKEEEKQSDEPSPIELARDPEAAARKQAAALYEAQAKQIGAAFSLAV